MPFLLDQLRDGQPAETRIEGGTLRIGRGTNADLRLQEAALDLEHARIESDPAGYRLIDCGSDTGTYINGRPAEGAYLKDGDSIDLGGASIKVSYRGPDEALRLIVRPVAAAVPAVAAAKAVDYLGAYRLRRPFLTKGLLALLLAAAALAAVAALPRVGAHRAFQPGEVSEAHRKEMAVKHPAFSCAGCHRPWRGPVEQQCLACHQEKRKHQERQAFDPPCANCHFEHRGSESLTLVDDASCAACHADLKVKGREGGAVPAVARRITAFPADHADFSVLVAPGRRLPISTAVTARADPARVKFGHLLHLRAPLRLPDGRRAPPLACADCHKVAAGAGPTGMEPVRYETACAACHLLTFDARRATRQVPHDDPARVRDFVLQVYSDRRDPALTLREIRSRVLRGSAPETQIDFSASANRSVREAERYLFNTVCKECHDVDADARPVPVVAPIAMQRRWLALTPFPHDEHTQGIACEDCHAAARSSRATADVLIPGIAACGGCHGGGGPPPGKAIARSAATQCRSCHDYHPRPRGPERLGSEG